MTISEAYEVIRGLKADLECSVEHDLYTTLDTEFSREVLEAINLLVKEKPMRNKFRELIKKYRETHTELETAIYAAGLGLNVNVANLEEEELELRSGRPFSGSPIVYADTDSAFIRG